MATMSVNFMTFVNYRRLRTLTKNSGHTTHRVGSALELGETTEDGTHQSLKLTVYSMSPFLKTLFLRQLLHPQFLQSSSQEQDRLPQKEILELREDKEETVLAETDDDNYL